MSGTIPEAGMNNAPISVLMSVYGAENPEYLRISLASIWKQSLPAAEVVVVEDGPLPESLHSVLAEFEGGGVPLVRIAFPVNRGLSAALNLGLAVCKCNIVARMDSDDICFEKRFERQFWVLNTNPMIDILGTSAVLIDFHGKPYGLMQRPIDADEIAEKIWACPIIHPSVMFRKERIIAVGGYNPDAGHRQDDYDLWIRCAIDKCRFANLSEPLLYYRYDETSVKKNSVGVGFRRLCIGLNACIRLRLGLMAYLGICYPLIRALVPFRMRNALATVARRFDPRGSSSFIKMVDLNHE